MKKILIQSILILFVITNWVQSQKLRPRDMGLEIGLFQTGKWNAITDVYGVKVGHETIIRGDKVRTGVTIILPHSENLFDKKVMAAVHVTNGLGRLWVLLKLKNWGLSKHPLVLQIH